MHVPFFLCQILWFNLFYAIKFIPDPNTPIIASNGISIKTEQSNVNTTSTKWIIDPISNIGYDMLLQISNQYGFNNATASTIMIEIDGFTPYDSRIGGEILMLFTSNNYQYFSVVINLENNIPWKSYPNDQNSPLATNSDVITNIIGSNNTRWNKISNNNQWTDIGGTTPYTRDLRWPLNINITNDPVNNKVYYKCTEPKNTGIETTFNTAFHSDQGLDIYIMNNGTNNPFHIYSFEIISSHNTQISSSNPTNSPTIIPTIPPTISPVLSPPISPALTPTISPALTPTISPTISPVLSPTISPVLSPAIFPALTPTISPVLSPTIAPILSTTFEPSFAPTERKSSTEFPTVTRLVTMTPTTIIPPITVNPTNYKTTDLVSTITTHHDAEITETLAESIEIVIFSPNEIQSDMLIYIVITSVAILCFIFGVVIGIVVCKQKTNSKNAVETHKIVPSMDVNNHETGFKFNAYVNPELTQQQNELQVELNRIMSGNDQHEEAVKYMDDEKLIIEDDVTNVMIIRNGLTETNSDDEVVKKIPTIESIHGHVVNTKRKSSNYEGNVQMHNDTAFVDK